MFPHWAIVCCRFVSGYDGIRAQAAAQHSGGFLLTEYSRLFVIWRTAFHQDRWIRCRHAG